MEMKMKPRKQEKLINDNSHSLTETTCRPAGQR